VKARDLEDGANILMTEGSGVITKPLNLDGNPLANIGDGAGLGDGVNMKQLGIVAATIPTLPIAEADLTLNFPTHDNSLDHDGGAQDIAIGGKADIGHTHIEAECGLNFPTHSNALDHANTNDPSADQKAALAGTSGTPSSTNKYVTDADARNSDSRTPNAHVLDGALHTVSGLTAGHFLKATGATTFGFAAHGLTAASVGAVATSGNETIAGNKTFSGSTVFQADVSAGSNFMTAKYKSSDGSTGYTGNQTISDGHATHVFAFKDGILVSVT